MKIFDIFSGSLAFFAVLFAAASPLHAAELNTTSTLTDTVPVTTIPSATPAKFAPSIEDLPLMPQLEPVADEDTLFVVPNQGRIAESTAAGAVDIDSVYMFYKRSLPQLGWKVIDARTYLRENEKLRIDAHADGKVTTVHFSVRPNS